MISRWWRGAPALLLGLSVACAPAAPAGAARPWDPWRAHREAGAQVSHLPVPASGVVRWVASNGDDRGKGTAGSPWRTVRHAVAHVGAGATIVVYGRHAGHGNGVYADESWGRIATPGLTIMAAPGERPRVTGARVLPSDRSGGTSWRRDDRGWFRDITVRRGDRWPANPYPIADQVTEEEPLAADPHQLFVGPNEADVAPLRQVAVGDDGAGPGVHEFSYEPADATRPTVRLRVGADPTGLTYAWSTRQTAVQIEPRGRGTRIVGISFERFAPYHGNTLAAVRILADDVRLIDVAVVGSAGTGIAATGENGTLRHPLRGLVLRRVTASGNGALGATVGDAGGEGSDPSADNHVTVEYSRFDDNNSEGFDALDCGDGNSCVLGGMKLVRVNGLTVRYSSFSGNASAGLWCDLYCDRVSIVGDFVADNALSGIFVEVSRRSLIASNVVAGNGTASGSDDEQSAGVKVTGSTGVTLEHNTLYGNAPRQIAVGADHRDDESAPGWHAHASGMPRLDLVGNLFVETAGGSGTVVEGIGSESVEAGWFGRVDRNGYVLDDAGTLPAEDGIARRLLSPVPEQMFRDAAGLDLRVANPTVAGWRTPPLSAPARRMLQVTRVPAATVGASFAEP
ncbi:MAG: right-handed parallel beta-helix repeat-containing protein [Acidimicrobiales bacterium]